jgi:hypothetical protein
MLALHPFHGVASWVPGPGGCRVDGDSAPRDRGQARSGASGDRQVKRRASRLRFAASGDDRRSSTVDDFDSSSLLRPLTLFPLPRKTKLPKML